MKSPKFPYNTNNLKIEKEKSGNTSLMAEDEKRKNWIDDEDLESLQVNSMDYKEGHTK